MVHIILDNYVYIVVVYDHSRTRIGDMDKMFDTGQNKYKLELVS